MSDARYRVELHFDPQNQTARTKVHAFLKSFGHLSPRHIKHAVGSGKLILKNNISFTDAVSIQKRVAIEGTTCKIKERVEGGTRKGNAPGRSARRQTVREVSTKQMVCPQCNETQPLHSECRNCGIIFSRINNRSTPSADQQKRDAIPRHDLSGHGDQKEAERPGDRHLLSFKALSTHLLAWRHRVRRWSQKPLNAILDCSAYTAAAFVVQLVLFFTAKYLWYLITATSVGEHYRQSHPAAAMAIEQILNMGVISLSVQVIITALIINLLIGIAAQLTHLSGFYLDGDSAMVKSLWILSSALVTAWFTSQKDPSPPFAMAFVIALPPTLCLLRSCLNLTKTTIPGVGMVISGIAKAVRHRENIQQSIGKALKSFIKGDLS